MTSTLTATFETRRDAELVIERLVQEFKVDRKAITVRPEGDENSVGEALAGGDVQSAGPSEEARDDAPVEGRIVVSVGPAAEIDAEAVRSAFGEFGGRKA